MTEGSGFACRPVCCGLNIVSHNMHSIAPPCCLGFVSETSKMVEAWSFGPAEDCRPVHEHEDYGVDTYLRVSTPSPCYVLREGVRDPKIPAEVASRGREHQA